MVEVNHPLGGGHPDAVLFSTHVMETWGGDPRRDFGGYLEAFSEFLDEHLVAARQVVFDDRPGRRHAKKRRRPVKLSLDERAMAILSDGTLNSHQVARRLGITASYVRQLRSKRGIVFVGSNGPTCQLCGADLPAGSSPNRRFCSQACISRNRRGSATTRVTECAGCGEPMPPGAQVSKRFCSHNCGRRYRRGLDRRDTIDET
jgi:predicted nucleic acid-binding Zn ribbon protein